MKLDLDRDVTCTDITRLRITQLAATLAAEGVPVAEVLQDVQDGYDVTARSGVRELAGVAR